jgi:BRCA1-associated protein
MRGYHIRILVHRKRDSNSKVEEFIPEHLFSKLPAQKPKSTQRRSGPAETPKSDYRFGFIRIDWMDMEDVGSSSGHIKKNKDQGRGTLLVWLNLV